MLHRLFPNQIPLGHLILWLLVVLVLVPILAILLGNAFIARATISRIESLQSEIQRADELINSKRAEASPIEDNTKKYTIDGSLSAKDILAKNGDSYRLISREYYENGKLVAIDTFRSLEEGVSKQRSYYRDGDMFMWETFGLGGYPLKKEVVGRGVRQNQMNSPLPPIDFMSFYR
jgi:hypothetical protein